jgi:hypothetical protein
MSQNDNKVRTVVETTMGVMGLNFTEETSFMLGCNVQSSAARLGVQLSRYGYEWACFQ